MIELLRMNIQELLLLFLMKGFSWGWEYIKGKLFGGRTQLKIEDNAHVNVPIFGEIGIPFSYSKE